MRLEQRRKSYDWKAQRSKVFAAAYKDCLATPVIVPSLPHAIAWCRGDK